MDVNAWGRSAIIWLMMPGGHREMVLKSVRYRPDTIVPCLEDGVRYDDASKKQARWTLTEAIPQVRAAAPGVGVFPRINHPTGEYWRADVDSLVGAGVDGIVIPKAEHADEVRAVADYLTEREAGAGVMTPAQIVAMIETPKGLLAAESLAAADDRVVALLFGREDYSAAVGLMRRHRDSLREGSPELLYARSRVATVAQAYGIGAIDGASFTFVDQDYMRGDASLTARIGFTGKLAAHPAHVESIRYGFTPVDDDIAAAHEIVELERASAERGEAAVGAVRGMEVTPPIVEQARLLLRRAEWARQGTTA
jgi:citrate lyase subunit beta / citryl-CoA lyase